jgi:hypothetical protein
LFLYDIFKVIYSPVKAFREALENPRLIGPVLIIIISLFLTFGAQYVSVSKHYTETITPTNPRDLWTNMTNPSSMWTSNAPPENITAASNANSDFLAGNYSVRAFVSNMSEIQLKTISIGTINCSGTSGFRTLYYKLMYSSFNQTQAPQNATLRLLSLDNESDYFEFNLLNNPLYLNKSQTWTDANVTLGSEWTSNGTPTWENITGIEFTLIFPQKGQLSLHLNDLYFGGKYEPFVNTVGLSNWLTPTVFTSVFDILLRWLVFAGLLWLTVKVFQPKGSPFKTLLIIVGYSFAITFVYVSLYILSVPQLPILYLPNKVDFPLTGLEIATASSVASSILDKYWVHTITYNFLLGIEFISYAWTIGLFSIGLKTLQEFSWKKAFAISLVAYVMGLFVMNILSSLGL